MSKASMTRLNVVHNIVGIFLLIFVLTAGSCTAEIFRPLQILLPGNLNGSIVDIDRNLKITPALSWRIVELLNSFKKLRDKDSLVIAPGNDSNIYSPLSYLFRGQLERSLIGECQPDSMGVSPDDLEMFADSNLNSDIRQRVWTNHETLDHQSIFVPCKTHKADNQNIWYFNFISPDYCEHLPIDNWGNFTIDSPQRSLRRLAPAMSANDISLSTVYLNENEIKELAAELKTKPGWHLIIQVALDGATPLFSTISPQQQNNLWFMSITEGHSYLSLINIFRRNAGYPRLTLRRIPFSKASNHKADELFAAAEKKIKKSVVEPLRVIRPSFQASTSAFRFAGKQYAHLIKQAGNSDVIFLKIPPMQHLVDNVICTGHILATMGNDRIHSFRLSGQELFDLATTMVKNSDTIPSAFAGCEITWFAGRVNSLKISGQHYQADKNYQVSITEGTLSDPALHKLGFFAKMRGYEGMTLWKIWLSTLKSFAITDEQLLE